MFTPDKTRTSWRKLTFATTTIILNLWQMYLKFKTIDTSLLPWNMVLWDIVQFMHEQITDCSANCHMYCINRSKWRRSAKGVSKQRSHKIFLIELERLELSYDLNQYSQYCSLISFSCAIIQPFIWQCQINLLTLLISGCYP